MMTTKKVVQRFVQVCIAALILIAGLAVYHRAFADNKVIVCETDRNGRMCCWDTNQYGPNRPYICN
jgi:hypothetical protein